MNYSNGKSHKMAEGISLDGFMSELENGLHELSQKDLKTVTSEFVEKITSQINEDPVASVKAALLMGAGLGSIRGESAKRALMVGVKLVSLKLLSQVTAATAAGASEGFKNGH